jgi:nucleoside-diphosphate-sugar epimerase
MGQEMRFERVVVTGGSGRLGRFVVEELLGSCAVSVMDIAPPQQDVPYAEADILDPARVRDALAGQEAMIHLAGIDDGRAARERDYFETNVQGAWNVFRAAEAAGLEKVVVASSIAALGFGWDCMPDYLPVDEAHPARCRGAYGHSKEVIESLARHFVRRGGLEILCLRPTLIVRPEREAAILAQLALPDPDSDPPEDAAAGPDGNRPYGALSATRSYVRSKDAARCFRLALDHRGAAYDVFNVSAVDGIGRPRTLERLEKVYGRLPEVRDPGRFERDPYAGILDIGRTRAQLGWEPQGDWTSVAAQPDASPETP